MFRREIGLPDDLERGGAIITALFFGATLDREDQAGGLQAHAWVVSGPVTITGGGGSFARFATLACFLRTGR